MKSEITPQLMVEAEFRFKSTMKDMTSKLDLIKKVFNDTSCATFLDIDNYLRARLAKSCLISMVGITLKTFRV